MTAPSPPAPRPFRLHLLSPIRLLGLAVLVAGAVVFLRHVSGAGVLAAFRHADVRLLLCALLMNALTLLVKAERWTRMLRPVAPLRRRTALRFLLIGFALNSTLPVSAGDVMRVFLVSSRTGAPRGALVSTIVLERLVEAIALGALMIVALPLLAIAPWLQRAAQIFVGVIAVAVALVAWLMWTHRGAATARGLVRLLSQFTSVARGLSSRGVLLPMIVLSGVEWALQTLSYTWGIAAFRGGFPWQAAFVCLCAVNIALLARVTPGGVGAYQLAFAAVLTLYGVSKETGLAISAAHHIVTVAPPVIVGIISLISLPAGTRREALAADSV